MRTYLIVTLLALFSLSACKSDSNPEGNKEIKGAGITFIVPNEFMEYRHDEKGIRYVGDSVKAVTDGKTLKINNKDYGTLKKGDVVDLRTKGKVLVNGDLRERVK